MKLLDCICYDKTVACGCGFFAKMGEVGTVGRGTEADVRRQSDNSTRNANCLLLSRLSMATGKDDGACGARGAASIYDVSSS